MKNILNSINNLNSIDNLNSINILSFINILGGKRMNINDFIYTYVVNTDFWKWIWQRLQKDKSTTLPIIAVSGSLLTVTILAYLFLVVNKYEASFNSLVALFTSIIYGEVVARASGSYESKLAEDFCFEKGYYDHLDGFRKWIRFCMVLFFTLFCYIVLLFINGYMNKAMMSI